MIFYVNEGELEAYPLRDRSNIWVMAGTDVEYHVGDTLCSTCGWSFIIVKPGNRELVCPVCATDEQRGLFSLEAMGIIA